MKTRIATRSSALALWQADDVAHRLRKAHPGLETERLEFTTTGDRFLGQPLSEIGGKGLFTKELEVALLDGDADIAVHSLKDMPTALPDGLVIGAVTARGDVRDCVVTRAGESPETAGIIGTSSLRRTCLARVRWPQARIQSIRGKVETRLGRLHAEGDRRVDAVLLAWVGLLRLKLNLREDLAFLPLNPDRFIPAVGQGALAIECRADDVQTLELLKAIHHLTTAACIGAERAFLAAVEGDCRVPVGALATHDRGTLRLRAFVGHPESGEVFEHTAVGEDPQALGAQAAERILAAGGAAVLASLRDG